jgi:hypothetical protein
MENVKLQKHKTGLNLTLYLWEFGWDHTKNATRKIWEHKTKFHCTKIWHNCAEYLVFNTFHISPSISKFLLNALTITAICNTRLGGKMTGLNRMKFI